MSLSASLLLFSLPYAAEARCTALGVGQKASADGESTFVSHNDDDTKDDVRMAYVPPREEKYTSPIYPYRSVYPRYVGYDRGTTYYPKDGQKVDLGS